MTIILCTHSDALMRISTSLCVMQAGRIVDMGSYEQLSSAATAQSEQDTGVTPFLELISSLNK